MIGAPTLNQAYVAWAIGSCRQRVDADDCSIAIPEYAAVCPKCGGKLMADFEEWEEGAIPGRWRCAFAKLECETEPDIDDPEFDEWMRWHYDMPYVYWLPLETQMTRWINRRYWFDLGVSPARDAGTQNTRDQGSVPH